MKPAFRLIAFALALWLPLQLGTAWALSASMLMDGHGHGHEHAHRTDHGPGADPHRMGEDPHCPHHLSGAEAPGMPAQTPCIDCGFCLVASSAFLAAAMVGPGPVASGSLIAGEVRRPHGIAVPPPDPPPIA
jgi:hypothetical protein